MRATLGVTFGLALTLSTGGCVTAEGSFKETGLANAVFDLQCPAEQVTSIVLVRNDGLGSAGSKVGVRGCGKQTTYLNDGLTWLRESEVQSVEAAPLETIPAPAPVPPTP